MEKSTHTFDFTGTNNRFVLLYTLSKPVVDQLLVLTEGVVSFNLKLFRLTYLGAAMKNHDRPAALAIHVDLLTRGSLTDSDDIGLWMSGIKRLILRL